MKVSLMAWRKKKIVPKRRKSHHSESQETLESLNRELKAMGLPAMKNLEMGYAVINAFRESDMEHDAVAIEAINAIKDMENTHSAKSELMKLSRWRQDDADKFERFADEF